VQSHLQEGRALGWVSIQPMPEFVKVEVDGGVAVVRLDRPPVNAISHHVAKELLAAFGELARSDDVGAIVIWGGPKIFAAGADIKEIAGFGPDQIRPVVTALGDALDLLEGMPKISIAAVNGYALGGGFEVALAADIRYLAQDAKVGQSEIAIGVIPGAGGSQRITQLAGPGVARELIYSGRTLGAEEARSLGLCHEVVEPAGVLERAMDAARGFAGGPRQALAAAKAAIRAAVSSPGPAGIAAEKELFIGLFGGSDQREGMAAFLDKRRPDFGAGPSPVSE
jgi:enoyl-CoA hydratase/carnithine racemase